MANNILQNVSRETFLRLKQYEELVRQYQKALNLVSPKTLPELWQRHIVDSAQIHPFIAQKEQGGHLVDLGSGGGFPGLVLACMLGETWQITLVESDQRKAIFLREAARQLGLSHVKVLAERIEQVDLQQPAHVVTARALAALPILWGWVQPLLALNGQALLMKGRDWQQELQATDLAGWVATPHVSTTDHEAVILEIVSRETI